jgi:hypothetical protein
MSAAPPAAAPKRQPRRLRRIAWRTLLALVALALVLRLALPFAVPVVLDRIAAAHGLTATYRDLELSILGGEVALYRLQVAARPAEGEAPPPPYLDLEQAVVDVDMSALWTGTLHVHRVEVDGADLLLERDADGSWVLARHFAGGAAPAEAPAPEPAPPGEAQEPLDLSSPLWVDAIRAQHVRARVIDRAATPAVDTWIEASVRISDVGAPDRATRVEVVAQGPDLLDRFALLGTVEAQRDRLQASFDLDVDGAHPQSAAQWLAALGITPAARALEAHAHLAIDAAPAPGEPTALRAETRLERVRLLADAHEEFAIDALHGELFARGARGLEVARASVRGVRGRAATMPDGALAVLGLEVRAPPAAAPAEVDEPEPAGASAPFALGELQIADVALAFRDGGVQPAADLELAIDGIALRDLRPDRPATLELHARAPGVAEEIEVAATFGLLGADRSLHAEVAARQVTLARLEQHLENAGLRAALQDGELRVAVDAEAHTDAQGVTRAAVRIEGLQMSDGDVAKAGVARIAIEDVEIDPARRATRVGAIEIAGVTLPVRRSSDGALHFFGLHTLRASAEAAVAASAGDAAPSPPAAAAEPAPRLQLDALRVRDVTLAWMDEACAPPAHATSRVEVDVDDLVLGGDVAETAPREAKLRAVLRTPEVAELSLQGSLASRPGPLDVQASLQLVTDGMAAGPLAPYLASLGVHTTLRSGSLRATLNASARAQDGELHASATLTDLSLTDGDGPPLAALDALRASDVVVGPNGVRVGDVAIDAPRVRARRTADGAVEVVGFRFAPRPAAAAAPSPDTAPPGAAAAEAPGALSLGHLELRDLQFEWRDEATPQPVELALAASARVDDLALGDARPARVALELNAGGVIDHAAITGIAQLDPADLRAELHVEARGLRAATVAPYLPESLGVTLQDGRFAADVAARVQRNDEGGVGLELRVEGLDYRDGASEEPLLACEALRIDVPQVDATRIEVAELSMRGTRARARRAADGATEIFGLALRAAADTQAPAPARTDEADAVPAALQKRVPRRVAVGKLDLEVTSFRWEDAAASDTAPPLDLRARVYAPAPFVLLDPDPAAMAPFGLVVEAAAPPLMESARVQLRAAPGQGYPQVDAELELRGLHGAHLPELLPSLCAGLDGTGLDGGSIIAKASAQLALRVRSGIEFDLSRGFGAEISITDVQMRATPDGEVLAGIDGIDVQVPRIAPDGSMHIERLGIEGLRGRIAQTPRGLEVAGLVLPRPPQPAGDQPAPAPVPEPEPDPAVANAQSPGPTFALDELSIHGLDFVYTDTTVDPPLTVPLDGLDLDVTGIGSRALREARPIHFALFVRGGSVELPKVQAQSLLGNVLGAAMSTVVGQGEAELEPRPLFDELAAQGKVTLYPELEGRVRTSLSAFELYALRSMAESSGVRIDDGVLDVGAEVTFGGAQGSRVSSRLGFDRLALAEPIGGPISSYLKLPAPLGTVLFALRDDQDRIDIPLDVTISSGGLSAAQIAGAVVQALSTALTNAVAAAPLRATGAITGVLGVGLGGLFGGGDAPTLAEQSVSVRFLPADASLGAEGREALRSLVELLEDDPDVALVLTHAFGARDYERAALLANPSGEQARELVARLRQQRLELDRVRGARGAAARVRIESGTEGAEEAIAELQELDRAVGDMELALDRALELLRRDAGKRADNRTRAAAVDIGNRRVAAVRRALLELGGEALDRRIDVRRARAEAPQGEEGGAVTALPVRRKSS